MRINLLKTTRTLAAAVLIFAGGTAFAQNLSPGVGDVGRMVGARVPEQTVIDYAKSSGVTYHLTPDDIIYLNSQGATPGLMDFLMSSGPPPAAAPAQPPPPTPAAPPPDASAAPAPNIDLPYFQSQLGPYGTWVDYPPYGQVWHPGVAINDPLWRPYRQGGHWVMTDAGWYWQADDPWGAVVFHYGRWIFDADQGWLWVPGYNWAPSWVAWRRAEGVYGWAPLPPQAEFVAGVGISLGGGIAVDAHVDFGLGAAAFTFVDFGHIWTHDYVAVVLPPERVDIVFRTSIIQNSYHVEGGRFVAEGFGRADVELRTGRPVEIVDIHKQVTVEHITVVKNVTNVRNVTIRNNVTNVRNVTNVKNVSNVKNVNNTSNIRNVNNESNVRNVNTEHNVANERNVNTEHNANEKTATRSPNEPYAQHPASTQGGQHPGAPNPNHPQNKPAPRPNGETPPQKEKPTPN